jgi:hypothetical protein
MSLYEPLPVDPGGRHRMDLHGWYTQFTDLGWHVDIVHPDQVVAGVLSDYRHLVVPTNSLYDLASHAQREALATAVRRFVMAGGTLLHGPSCQLAHGAVGVQEEVEPFDCIRWREEVIPHGWSTVSFVNGTALGTYLQSGRTAIAEAKIGAGRVLSFGFEYGYAYSRLTMPIVPPNYGKREMHPIVLLKETPVAALVGASPLAPIPPIKGVEFARFGSCLVVVNHRASPVNLGSIAGRVIHDMIPSAAGWLAAHSAMLFET